MHRIAVVGSGIAGLSAAYALAREARVTLFEAEAWIGGHAHTVDVELDGARHGVDTGFLVFNPHTYPGLVSLFDRLGVATAPSEMSFSVQAPSVGLEWCGRDLDGVFAQRRNLVSPRFWWMLAEIARFNRRCLALAEDATALDEPLGAFLDRERFGAAFRDGYLLPMLGCIWSCPLDQMLQFPLATLVRFCSNHGLLQVSGRPQWMTVRGGSAEYVKALTAAIGDVRTQTPVLAVRRRPPGLGIAGVLVETATGAERFDDVVLATHTDQALALLADASADERAVLGAIGYRPNRVVLHTDASVLPRQPRAWAAWNYERAADPSHDTAGVCLHYLINRLQPLPWSRPVIVSMNPLRPLRGDAVLGEWTYAHPVFDRAAIAAQRALPRIQGGGHVWFCGAWAGYGFHEDGLQAGLAVARALHERRSGATAVAA